MKTGTTLRRIASLYIDAADILDEIDRLRDDMDPDRKPDEQADDAAMWRERCRRYEAHMAEHVPMNYWPEIMGQTDAFVPVYVGPAAEANPETDVPWDFRRCACGHVWKHRPEGCDCIAPEPATPDDVKAWRSARATAEAPMADAAFEDAARKLGWDPDPLSGSKVRSLVCDIQDSDMLELVEALEKRRAHMRPAKKVREGVLDAIAAQRALLQPVGAKS
jgi:hypothetical protein